jgi:hypothetical protein
MGRGADTGLPSRAPAAALYCWEAAGWEEPAPWTVVVFGGKPYLTPIASVSVRTRTPLQCLGWAC